MTNFTAFLAHERVASGTRDVVERQILSDLAEYKDSILVFDDETGRVTDLDFRGTPSLSESADDCPG